MKKLFTFVASLSISVVVLGQVKIADSTMFAVSDGSIIAIETDSDLDANATDLVDANIILSLTGADQTISGNWSVDTLHILNGTFTNVKGTLTITGKMNFSNGILQPVDASANEKSKIVFTGDGNDLLWQPGNASFINGEFFQIGEGQRVFPVGSLEDGIISPLVLQDVKRDDEVGVKLVVKNPGLEIPPKMVQVDQEKYWIINTEDIAGLETRVGIPAEGFTLTQEEEYVVVQAAGLNSPAENLGRSSLDEFAFSDQNVSKPIVTLGTSTEIRLIIRDLITPSSSRNNRMVIDNISAYSNNHVRLLDRWGSIVHEWRNYTNDNTEFNFSTLAPGNYICIVECWDDGSNRIQKSQMITVIKTR